MATSTVEHVYYVANARDRYKALKRIADINPSIYGIIFCRTRRETKEIAENLMADGYNADALHGDLSQAQRDMVMNRFRTRNLQLLVATDVAARGIDINELTHVINYNLPDENAVYVHRSGRTGRAGRKGTSVTIIHSREMRKLKEAERRIGRKFTHLQIPSGKEICEKQLFNLVDKVQTTEVNPDIEQYLPTIYEKLEGFEREELIKHFVSVEFNSFLDYYKNARDLNVSTKSDRRDRDRGDDRRERGDRNDSRERSSKRSSAEFSRFFINVGSRDSLRPQNMIGLINDYMNRRDIEIGQIEIMKNFSFFEVDKKFEAELLNNFKDADYRGTSLSVEVSAPRQNSNNRNSSSKGDGSRTRSRSRKRRGETKRRRY